MTILKILSSLYLLRCVKLDMLVQKIHKYYSSYIICFLSFTMFSNQQHQTHHEMLTNSAMQPMTSSPTSHHKSTQFSNNSKHVSTNNTVLPLHKYAHSTVKLLYSTIPVHTLVSIAMLYCILAEPRRTCFHWQASVAPSLLRSW